MSKTLPVININTLNNFKKFVTNGGSIRELGLTGATLSARALLKDAFPTNSVYGRSAGFMLGKMTAADSIGFIEDVIDCVFVTELNENKLESLCKYFEEAMRFTTQNYDKDMRAFVVGSSSCAEEVSAVFEYFKTAQEHANYLAEKLKDTAELEVWKRVETAFTLIERDPPAYPGFGVSLTNWAILLNDAFHALKKKELEVSAQDARKRQMDAYERLSRITNAQWYTVHKQMVKPTHFVAPLSVDEYLRIIDLMEILYTQENVTNDVFDEVNAIRARWDAISREDLSEFLTSGGGPRHSKIIAANNGKLMEFIEANAGRFFPGSKLNIQIDRVIAMFKKCSQPFASAIHPGTVELVLHDLLVMIMKRLEGAPKPVVSADKPTAADPKSVQERMLDLIDEMDNKLIAIESPNRYDLESRVLVHNLKMTFDALVDARTNSANFEKVKTPTPSPFGDIRFTSIDDKGHGQVIDLNQFITQMLGFRP